ncbi:MAG: hypothetical protein LBU23_10820 [Planctomycetota bacterium]|jgi:phospholipid N-methyltransferase|nr:hypothetical protein [Planctomycetota bacterium]
MANGETRFFIGQLLNKPGSTGALLPSSGRLAARMIENARIQPDSVVAEYGPGTGAFTGPILRELKPGQRFFAIEVNENFAGELEKRFPDLHVHRCCASGVADCCRREGVDRVDRVVSGLPWAIFPDDLRDRILDAMLEVMPDGGVFVTFAYLHALLLPAARRFRRALGSRFSRVESSKPVWLNLPPALVYRCVK